MPLTRLTDKKEIFRNTYVFSFEKPAGFSFVAGQHIELKNPRIASDGAGGNNRVLSIASVPSEKEITVALRITPSLFKTQLLDSSEGDEFEINGPWGDFVLHKDVSRPAVFISGGIGVTCARSVIVDSIRRGTGHKIFLFHSSKHYDDFVFGEELRSLSKESKDFRLVETVTGSMDASEWGGERGRVNEEMIRRYVGRGDLKRSVFYLSGKRMMIREIREVLKGVGVDVSDMVIEEFSGY